MKKSQLKEIIREMIAQELEEGRIDQLRTKVDTAIKNDPHLVARKNTMRRISQQYAGASPDKKIPINFGLAHTTPARIRDDAIKSWGKKPQKVSEQELEELSPSTYRSAADERDDQASNFRERNPAAANALAQRASNLRKFARDKEVYGSISPATARKIGVKKPQKVSEQIRKKMAHDLKNESLRNKLYDPEFRKKYIDDMNKQYGIKPKSAPAGDGNKSTPPKDKEKTKN